MPRFVSFVVTGVVILRSGHLFLYLIEEGLLYLLPTAASFIIPSFCASILISSHVVALKRDAQ